MLFSLSHISVKREQHYLLKDVSLSINKGQIITVIGPNGGGKTTLLKVVLGLTLPSEGCVNRSSFLRIGYMPQKMHISPLMPMTVERFLSLCIERQNQHVLDLVGVGRRIASKQLSTLSGGEWQRVLLARCLLRSPNFLILDEPTQGVDAHGQVEMYQRLLQIQKEFNCAILMVTHDLRVVFGKSDLVICLNQHICCSGTPQDVMDSKTYQELGFYHHAHMHE